jgi:hypothetical protein
MLNSSTKKFFLGINDASVISYRFYRTLQYIDFRLREVQKGAGKPSPL